MANFLESYDLKYRSMLQNSEACNADAIFTQLLGFTGMGQNLNYSGGVGGHSSSKSLLHKHRVV